MRTPPPAEVSTTQIYLRVRLHYALFAPKREQRSQLFPRGDQCPLCPRQRRGRQEHSLLEKEGEIDVLQNTVTYGTLSRSAVFPTVLLNHEYSTAVFPSG